MRFVGGTVSMRNVTWATSEVFNECHGEPQCYLLFYFLNKNVCTYNTFQCDYRNGHTREHRHI